MRRPRSSSRYSTCNGRPDRARTYRRVRHARPSGHALALAAAIVALAEFPPIVIPGEAPIPLPVIIPEPGAPIHIPRFGDRYTWDDVFRYGQGLLSDSWDWISGAASLNLDVVKHLIDDAISVEQSLWSGFVNLAIDVAVTGWSDSIRGIDAITGFAIGWVATFIDEIDYLSKALLNLGGPVIGGILARLLGLEGAIVNGIDGAIHHVERWAIDHIYNPLDGEIRRVERTINDRITGTVDTLRGDINDAVHSEALRRIAAVAAVAAVLARVATWVRECGEPTCNFAGPGSDLQKVWKALNLAGTLAALAAVGALTEDQVERLAASVAASAGGDAAAFVRLFVDEGDTLAAALAATLPEIGI